MEKLTSGVNVAVKFRCIYASNLIIHRWLRFVPVLFGTLAVAWVAPIFNFEQVDDFMSLAFRQFSNGCKSSDTFAYNWWNVIFMIQTWGDNQYGDACIGWIWYVTTEFWFYRNLRAVLCIRRRFSQRFINEDCVFHASLRHGPDEFE